MRTDAPLRRPYPALKDWPDDVDRFSRWLLSAAGWRLVGQAPAVDKYVVILYPHTSNWDFPLSLLTAWGLRVPMAFLAKDALFKGPMGWFFRAVGGIPVRRQGKENAVSQVTRLVAGRKRIALSLAPEGTRAKADHWKSGFYYIALESKMPVALGFIDASTRTLGFGPLVELTGDPKHDLEVFRAFYADKRGLHPEQASPIAFR